MPWGGPLLPVPPGEFVFVSFRTWLAMYFPDLHVKLSTLTYKVQRLLHPFVFSFYCVNILLIHFQVPWHLYRPPLAMNLVTPILMHGNKVLFISHLAIIVSLSFTGAVAMASFGAGLLPPPFGFPMPNMVNI